MIALMTFIAGLWLGHQNGWIDAHRTIARECERLGGFYVNNKTYKCTQIKDGK